MTRRSRSTLISSDELSSVIEASGAGNLGSVVRVRALSRSKSVWAETATLEEVIAHLHDGRDMPLMLKFVSRKAIIEAARGAKPKFVHSPFREIELYRDILDPQLLGTALVYGLSIDPGTDHGWILLERLAGSTLSKIGDFEAWTAAARWAARFHKHFSTQIDSLPVRAPHLLRYDAAYYRRWMPRAMTFTGGVNSNKRHALRHLARRHETFVAELSQLPVSLIHGEFYGNNIMVEQNESGLRVCPIDWEMAAIGPSVFDLAAVSAFWRDSSREALVCAYCAARAAVFTEAPDTDDILRQVDLCSLQMAVQWLGWSRRWSPHRGHDWLSEVGRLVERLDL